MRYSKTIIFGLIALLLAGVFLPAASAHMVVPMVGFAGNTSGQAFVAWNAIGSAGPGHNYHSLGFGMFSIMGQAYLLQDTILQDVVVLMADAQGLMLRDNRLLVNFDGQTISISFMADAAVVSFFEDVSPYNDLFVLGDSGMFLGFYGTLRNATGTYSISGIAMVLCVPTYFSSGQLEPVWTLAVLLVNSDGSDLATVVWVAEGVSMQIDLTTFVPLSPAAVFGHSVDFILP